MDWELIFWIGLCLAVVAFFVGIMVTPADVYYEGDLNKL
jgi:hypothetical protein